MSLWAPCFESATALETRPAIVSGLSPGSFPCSAFRSLTLKELKHTNYPLISAIFPPLKTSRYTFSVCMHSLVRTITTQCNILRVHFLLFNQTSYTINFEVSSCLNGTNLTTLSHDNKYNNTIKLSVPVYQFYLQLAPAHVSLFVPAMHHISWKVDTYTMRDNYSNNINLSTAGTQWATPKCKRQWSPWVPALAGAHEDHCTLAGLIHIWVPHVDGTVECVMG